MSGGVPAGELRDFASLMVDEVIAKVRIQLDAGESLSVADQRLMLEQLIVERKRLHATPPIEGQDLPDNTYTPYGKRSARNLAELLGIASQEPTVVSVINRAYDEIVFLRAATPTPPSRDADVERVKKVARALCEYQIRQARRWDTEPDRLEEMMPAAVHYGWHYFTEQARAALQALGERG